MRQKTTLFVAMAMGLAVLGCRAEKSVESTASGSAAGQVSVYGNHDFTKVEVSGRVKTSIVQGASYSVEVTESANTDLQTIVEQQGQTLRIFNRQLKKNLTLHEDDTPVVRITMPTLTGVHGGGATAISIGDFTVQAPLTVGISGASTAHFRQVACGDMKIDCGGASKLDLDGVKCAGLRLQLSGASVLKTNVQAEGDITLGCGGASKLSLTLSGRRLTMTNTGASESRVSFTGESVDAQNSGAGKTELTVDCQELHAKNSGASVFTISGTADNTDISASGAAKINTSNLNKF